MSSLPIDNTSTHGHHHIRSSQLAVPASIVPLKGKIVGSKDSSSAKDSTSSAKEDNADNAHFVADPGRPKLLNPGNITDAEMFEAINLSLDKDRRTRRRTESEAMQMQLQQAMTWQEESQTVTISNNNNNNSNSPSQTGSTSSTTSSSSSSTSNTTSTPNTSTTSTNNTSITPPNNTPPNTSTTTATITQLKLETGALMNLEAALQVPTDNTLKARHHRPSDLMDQLQAYVHSALTSGLIMVVPTAVGLLGDPKLGLNTDNKSVEAATAVSYQNFALKWANSGDIQNFVNNYINSPQAQAFATQQSPHNPAAALNDLKVTLSTTLPSAVINSALEMTGKALGMPGYANQVRLQATLVRNENTVLTNPTHVSSIAENVAIRNAGIDGFSENQLQKLSAKAIHDTMFDKQGKPVEYLTHDDLVAALTTNFAVALPSNNLLASNLANDVADNTVEVAIGKNGVSVPSFDNLNFNVAKFQGNLATAISQEFEKSDEIIHAFTIAKEVADAIREQIDANEFRNEQAVRDFIKTQLINADSNITAQQASNIAAAVNIGGPQLNNPLFDPNNTGILKPNDFALALQMGYQDTLQVSPSSIFGDYINFVSGASGVAGNNSPIALINQAWYQADELTRSYLNPTAEDAAKFQQLTLGDPAAAVKEWGIQHNNKIKSSKIDILT